MALANDFYAVGLTRRQVEHWTQHDWIQLRDRESNTQGKHRVYEDTELLVAVRMLKLVQAGLPHPLAAQLARAGPGGHVLAPGVVVVYTDGVVELHTNIDPAPLASEP